MTQPIYTEGQEFLLAIDDADKNRKYHVRLITTFDRGRTWWAFEEISKQFTIVYDFNFSKFREVLHDAHGTT